MSILFQHDTFYFLDHAHYVNKVYEKVQNIEHQINRFQLLGKLFFIVVDADRKPNNNNRKRSRSFKSLLAETSRVKELHYKLISEVPEQLKIDIKNKYEYATSLNVRDLTKQLLESTLFDHKGIKGCNTADVSLECNILNEKFLIPPHCSFFCGCIKEQCKKLLGNKFDIVIADPPWWNKYIRRLKHTQQNLSYSMMYNEEIASIPVKELLSPNCLIAVWCTNSPSNITAVKEQIFPSWGVEYVTMWYWLKVTVDLEPVCEFNVGNKKQPYERLILGKVGDVEKISEDMVLVSVPSALHSHKPPLLDLLSKFINNKNPQTLELFARYLLPNTTSVGYEPLKLQHISFYEAVS